MLLEVYSSPWDFELLDTGDGYRLEKWGDTAPGSESLHDSTNGVILVRPDPQIIWKKSLPESEWQKAHAIFTPGKGEDKGNWTLKKPGLKSWKVRWRDVEFLLKLSPFKHTGLFAEQATNWNWMSNQLSKVNGQMSKVKILNLFAYTGGATMVLAKASCQVTHVDASKPALTWANENHKLNNLPSNSVRWILDDAVKFVKREVKRGAKYDGIIMDPPAFGHGPTGKPWKFNEDLPGLLADCVQLLSNDAKFLVINGYATNSSAIALNNLLEDAVNSRGGKIEFGELCLKQKSGRLISTGIFARWSL